MLEEVTLMNLSPFMLADDNTYYYQLDSKRLGHLKNTFLKIVPISWHYESHEGENWTIESLKEPPKTIPKALAFIRFKIVGVYYSLEKLFSKSKLKGFSRVLDDNNYFSRIPLVNELVHWDNGVIVTPNYQIAVKGLSNEHVENTRLLIDWSTYQLSVTNDRKGIERIIMTGERGHTHL